MFWETKLFASYNDCLQKSLNFSRKYFWGYIQVKFENFSKTLLFEFLNFFKTLLFCSLIIYSKEPTELVYHQIIFIL